MASVKKNEKEKPQEVPRFTKEQLICAKEFRSRRDLLNALLKADKCYTLEETREVISQFDRKKVN